MTAKRYIEVLQCVLLAMQECSKQILTDLPTIIRFSKQYGQNSNVCEDEVLTVLSNKPIDWIP